MFVKFASLEVLDVKSAPSRVHSASLSKFADYDDYRTDDGYVYVRVRAISSRVNKNHDGWPSEELKKSYRSFIGKPIFVDHHNSDPKKARGVIVDAALHIEDSKTASLDPYYSSAPENHLPPTWIELLLEVDAKRFPKLAKAIIDGDIDGVSMGANVELSKCSHCGNEARSPEEYCKHVQSKGAHFDWQGIDGKKTSKKSYEDCYDIGFFEISFVFDPADETALVSDIKHTARLERIAAIRAEGDNDFGDFIVTAKAGKCESCGKDSDNLSFRQGDGFICDACGKAAADADDYISDYEHKKKTADQNPMPQSEMTTAPDKVNTLRQEQVCPICGSNLEDGVCEVCNYEEPPEGFDNPDLSKAKEVDEQMHQQDAEQAAQGQQNVPSDVTPGPGNGPQPMPSGAMPGVPGPTISSTANNRTSDTVSSETTKTSAANGRINTQERPILPVTRKLTDKPLAKKTISEATKPVLSTQKENMTQTQKTADGATALGEGVQAEKRVDVEGVGAVSGDPLSGIDHENVEKDTGDFTAPHTDTWSDGEGDSLGQHDPVTNETGDLFTVAQVTAADAEDNAGNDIGDGASSDKGGPTWDSSDAGFPDHQPARVDLLADLKEEVGEGTKTFQGDDFHITNPVTKGENANSLGGPIGVAVAKAKAIQMKAFQVAETEIELGIADAENKYARVAALEDNTEEALDATLDALAKVKTAGLRKQTTPKTAATRMPSLRPVTASFDIEAHSVSEINVEDAIW